MIPLEYTDAGEPICPVCGAVNFACTTVPGGGLHAERTTYEMAVRSDRRLWLNSDKSRVVEDGDPDASFLLAAPGQLISDKDVERYGIKSGRKNKPSKEPVQTAAPKPDENKAQEPEAESAPRQANQPARRNQSAANKPQE